MIRVAVNGYGTIGKRVADAVAAQPDMEIVGVSKTKPSAEAYIAKMRGYPLYIADLAKKPAFDKAGIPVAGSVDDMLKKADIVIDATPGDVGAKNKPTYEKLGIKAIFQGGEEHEVAGFSFNSDCNYKDGIGKQFARVVSCNTTGLCRIINAMDKAYGVEKSVPSWSGEVPTRERSKRVPSMQWSSTPSRSQVTMGPMCRPFCPTSRLSRWR